MKVEKLYIRVVDVNLPLSKQVRTEVDLRDLDTRFPDVALLIERGQANARVYITVEYGDVTAAEAIGRLQYGPKQKVPKEPESVLEKEPEPPFNPDEIPVEKQFIPQVDLRDRTKSTLMGKHGINKVEQLLELTREKLVQLNGI